MTFSAIRRALAAATASVMLASCVPCFAEATPSLRINEVMTSNRTACKGSYGYADWVEIANTGNEPVNLKNHTLTRGDDPTAMFQFPNMTLNPGEFAMVWMDDVDRAADPNDLHAQYRLSSSGVTLLLADAAGNVLDTVNVPALEDNSVYMREGEEWVISYSYTPMLANTEENHALCTGGSADVSNTVVFGEVMPCARSYMDGVDWLELTNVTNGTIDVSGWYVTDDMTRPDKYRVPDGTEIAPGGVLLLVCDAKNGPSFRLSRDGCTLTLYDATMNRRAVLEVPALEADRSYSLVGGRYTANFAPTPGLPNTVSSADSIRAAMEGTVVISEIAALAQGHTYDWIELYNTSAESVDLSGWGLSDKSGHPRAWTFPEGTVIEAGKYLTVYCRGTEGTLKNGSLCASFSLNAAGGYDITLCLPNGTLTDRVYVPEQTDSATYSRYQSTFIYTPTFTPNAANSESGYSGRATKPRMTAGGLFSTPVTVEIDVPDGETVYYTTDCTEPTEHSNPYTGPFTVSGTTVVRARSFANGCMSSYVETQTYFFDVHSTVRVVSVVSEPDAMFGSKGLYKRYNDHFEIPGHVEVYGSDGTAILREGCGLRLAGADSRALDQKNFKVVPRGKYGASLFEADLFPARGYEAYDGFVLRSTSEDQNKTRMRDSVLTALAEGTGLYYQPTELSIVYVNGQYWGHYNMRERICATSLCQFEGWEGLEDTLDIVTGNDIPEQGSNETFKELLDYLKTADMTSNDAVEYVGTQVDLDNYIAYIAIEMFTGNGDTMNVRRYRSSETDGKWRWILYDLDWGFSVDTNSMRRWLDPEGMGARKATNNALFVGLMKNADFRDRFLTFLGQQMAGPWSSAAVLNAIDTRYQELLPELPAQFERWGSSMKIYEKELAELREYAETRPGKLLGYIQYTLQLSDTQMDRYFGDMTDEIIPYTGNEK